jgi:hypothetical protein
MLKVIKTNREKPGGGPITRFAIETPWFSVWTDLCEMDLTLLRGQTEELCDMLVSTMGREIYRTHERALTASICEGIERIDE